MEKIDRLKQILILVVVGLILVSSCTAFSFAAEDASKRGNGMVTVDNLEKAGSSTIAIKEIEEKNFKYELDMEEATLISDPIPVAANFIAGMLYKGTRDLGYYSAYLTKFSMDFNLFDKAKGALKTPFEKLGTLTKDNISGDLGKLFLGLCIALAVFLFMKGRTTEGAGKIVQIIVVMVIALFFFTSPMKLMEGANQIAMGIGTSAFNTTTTTPAGTATDKAVNTVYNTMTVIPWKLLEFGDVNEKLDGKKAELLKYEPESEEREKIVDELKDEYRPLQAKGSVQGDRISTGFMALLMNLVLFVIVLFITFLILGLQIVALMLGLLAPIVFLAALLPNFGLKTIKNWAVAMLLIYLGITISLFGYGVYLLILNLVYTTLVKEIGLFLCFIIMFAMIVTLWFMRRQIFAIFGANTSSLDRMESRARSRTVRNSPSGNNGGGRNSAYASRRKNKQDGGEDDGQDQQATDEKQQSTNQAASNPRKAVQAEAKSSNARTAGESGKQGSSRPAGVPRAAKEDVNPQNPVVVDTKDGPDAKSGNIREQMRGKLRKDANGIPYREGSEYDKKTSGHPDAKPENLREEAKKQGQFKKDANGLPYREGSNYEKKTVDNPFDASKKEGTPSQKPTGASGKKEMRDNYKSQKAAVEEALKQGKTTPSPSETPRDNMDKKEMRAGYDAQQTARKAMVEPNIPGGSKVQEASSVQTGGMRQAVTERNGSAGSPVLPVKSVNQQAGSHQDYSKVSQPTNTPKVNSVKPSTVTQPSSQAIKAKRKQVIIRPNRPPKRPRK